MYRLNQHFHSLLQLFRLQDSNSKLEFSNDLKAAFLVYSISLATWCYQLQFLGFMLLLGLWQVVSFIEFKVTRSDYAREIYGQIHSFQNFKTRLNLQKQRCEQNLSSQNCCYRNSLISTAVQVKTIVHESINLLHAKSYQQNARISIFLLK